jgi:hypothetical protein
LDAEIFTTNGKNGIKDERAKGRKDERAKGRRQQAASNRQQAGKP